MTGGPILLAHGVGRVFVSPIPLALYLLGAGATVAISFIVRALSRRLRPIRPPRRVAGPGTARVVRLVLATGGLAALLLLVMTALVNRSEGFTSTTVLFWVGLFVVTTFASVLMAGTWPAADPWSAIESAYRLEEAHPVARVPRWWLGPLLLYALFWFELVSGVGFEDFWVFIVIVAYSLYVFTFRDAFGDAWASSDPFSILFGFAARVAPTRINDGGIWVQSPLTGLEEAEPMQWGPFLSVFLLLGSTTLDNARETVWWTNMRSATGIDALPERLVDSAALVACGVAFIIPFLVAVWLARGRLGGKLPLTGLIRTFGWSLVPIGVAYVLAHNASLLVSGAPSLIRSLSDPFLRGWNLFGTADFLAGAAPSPALIWWAEIGLIVGGHILGVLAAHRCAVRLASSHGRAVGSQVALTALMTVYTVGTLWLLSQPLVS